MRHQHQHRAETVPDDPCPLCDDTGWEYTMTYFGPCRAGCSAKICTTCT